MKSPFSLFRKWWSRSGTSRPAGPFWHVTVKVPGTVRGNDGEIYAPAIKLTEGTLTVKVPEQTIIQVHSRGPNE